MGDALTRRYQPSNQDETGRTGEEIRWTTVATAPDQLVAEMWQQSLREASIPSVLAPQDVVSFLGVSPSPVRVMVPQELKARAEGVLADLLASGNESPEADEASR